MRDCGELQKDHLGFLPTNVSKAFPEFTVCQPPTCSVIFLSLWGNRELRSKWVHLWSSLKVAQAEVIFPLVIKQNVFFLRLHRHLWGPYYLLNINGRFESSKSKPVLLIKHANRLCSWIKIIRRRHLIFFPNSEESYYLERKCRLHNPPEESYLSKRARACMCSDKSFSIV